MSRHRRQARIRALLAKDEQGKRITVDDTMERLAAQAAQQRKGAKA